VAGKHEGRIAIVTGGLVGIDAGSMPTSAITGGTLAVDCGSAPLLAT